MVTVRGVLYCVVGRYLYKVASDGTVTQYDRIDGSGIVGMSENGEIIHITTGNKDYLFDVNTEVLSTPTKTVFGYTSAYHNGRFVSEDPDATDQGRFYYSGIDGTTWSDLDFATAEQKTDDALRVFPHKGVLDVFGTRSTEFWGSDANGPIPIFSAYLNVGIAGRWSVASADEYVGFLASDGSFRILQGYNSQRVSTTAVEAALTADSSAEVLAYVEQGHTVFEISTSTRTLCYDLTQSQLIGKPVWFEKQSNGGRHKARFCVYVYGKLLTLSYNDGKVYELTRTAYPDAREFTLPHFAEDENRRWGVLDEVELIQRVGTAAIAHNTSQVMMRTSRDGGFTYGEERWSNEETLGQYDARVRYLRLGRWRQITMNFRKTDQTEWTVTGVHARGR